MSNFDFDPTREYRVTFNGVELPVEIEPEADGAFSPPQREALHLLLSLPPNVLELSAPTVVQNYDYYRELMAEAMNDFTFPPLENPVDVWKLVEPTEFRIPSHSTILTPTFMLFAECDWDPEHGLVVRFRNGVAEASGQQGDSDIEITG